MEARPLLGDEGVALGALHAGISGAYSYPGTPATEILEFISQETRGGPPARNGGVHHVWSANEKVAFEEALGMSYAGRRALVSFKHVGLNVAADPFMNASVTGVDGGLVVVSADDPGMHSSQNEQDSRVYAQFALIPCLEPSGSQEAYEMTREAFELSERFGVPVMIRLVTRIAHTRSGVVTGEPRAPNPLAPTKDAARWTLLPANARMGYRALVDKQPALQQWSESSRWNQLHLEGEGRRGVIVSGIAANYFLENDEGGAKPPPYLRLGAYPAPVRLIAKLLDAVDEVLVLEDGYPHLESALRGMLDRPRGKRILGKLDGTVVRTGELNPENVRAALGLPPRAHAAMSDLVPPPRPPRLCDGCPHVDSSKLLELIFQAHPDTRVFGDIGCYALLAQPPYQALHSCVDMGASIGMAMGAAQAGMKPVVAAIGDSTFMHSGMTPLAGAAKQNLDMKVFILDNSTVGMTGGQETFASGDLLTDVVKGLGVPAEHVHRLPAHPRHHAANAERVRRELDYPGLSVFITERECVVTARRS